MRAALAYGAGMRILVGLGLLLCACASRQIDVGPIDQGAGSIDLAVGSNGGNGNGGSGGTIGAVADLSVATNLDMVSVQHVCSSTCNSCAGPCCGSAC